MIRLHFLNYHHNGDIHYSKEFMRDLYTMIQPDKCVLHHKMHPSVIKDLPWLEQGPLMGFEENTTFSTNTDDDIYIVTWIGYYFIQKLVPTDMGCSLYSNHKAFKGVYDQLGLDLKPIEYYIPTVDYNRVEKDNVDEFVKTHNNKRILVSNGKVLSGQAENFDFTPIIGILSATFPQIDFILTENTPLTRPNVFYTHDIIQVMGCDLNEISYLSLSCDATIGRASGPIGFTHVKENFFNTKKLMIGISNSEPESFWYIPEKGFRHIWTNKYGQDHLISFIEEGLDTL